MKKVIKYMMFVLCMTGLLVSFSGCGNKISEDKLVGAWYLEGRDSPAFTLYNDGTCEMKGEYGTGTWALVNENQLKLTNYYGESDTATVISIEKGCMTLGNDENSDTIQLWNEDGLALKEKGDSSLLDNSAAFTLADFKIIAEANRIAVVQWTNESGLTDRGLMNCNGDVFFKFLENYPEVRTVEDNYIYGDKGIVAVDGTLLHQFPEDSDCSIVSYGNNIFMVKQHIENMTENAIKVGFMRPDGSWIIEPSIDVKENANDYVGCYVGEGYFLAYCTDGNRLFINPETGHRFISGDFISLKGISDGVVVVGSGLGTNEYVLYGIDLRAETEFKFEHYNSIFSIADGYIANENNTIYNMHGELVLDLPEYKITSDSYILDGCLRGHIIGADKETYIFVYNIQAEDFVFEPVKAEKIMENGNYALIYRDGRNYYLNFEDGAVEECEYPLSDIGLDIHQRFEDIFADKAGTYYSWENGKVKEIIPHASFK